jgi:transposase, IS30 family
MGQRYNHIDFDERAKIALLCDAGQSLRQIAAALDRAPSTISRELKRNRGNQVGYQPSWADDQSWSRRWRGSKLERQPALLIHVLEHLAKGQSPEQIAGRLALKQSSFRISHESIYRFIHAQIARTKDYNWRRYLPHGKSKRGWSRRSIKPVHNIKDRVSISQRPAFIEQRKQVGNWEVDLLHPQKSGACILVAVERATRMVLLAKQDSKHAKPIAEQLAAWFTAMPTHLRRTLTQDNGPEFSSHYLLNPLGIKTYFCNPHQPWQKGSVENMNGRIRRTIPLGTDPNSFDQNDLIALQNRLNSTPRKCLGYKTPEELFMPHLKPLHFKCESTFPPSRE